VRCWVKGSYVPVTRPAGTLPRVREQSFARCGNPSPTFRIPTGLRPCGIPSPSDGPSSDARSVAGTYPGDLRISLPGADPNCRGELRHKTDNRIAAQPRVVVAINRPPAGHCSIVRGDPSPPESISGRRRTGGMSREGITTQRPSEDIAYTTLPGPAFPASLRPSGAVMTVARIRTRRPPCLARTVLVRRGASMLPAPHRSVVILSQLRLR